MAKYERELQGDFNEFINILDNGILEGSASATLEETSYYERDGVRCAVHAFERYSYMGGNRVSLTVSLCGKGSELFVSAITTGGSQAMFRKINTIGEHNFLEKAAEIIDAYAG